MPGRRKTYPKIGGDALARIERQAGLLLTDLTHATLPMTTFSEHWNAISDLRAAIDRTLNILNDRAPDHSNFITAALPARSKPENG